MKQLFILFIIMACGISCHKPSVRDTQGQYAITGDYFIFGHPGGYIAGGTTPPHYLVNQSKLRMTQTGLTSIPDDVNKFSFNYIMPDSRYRQVADLPSSIPAELLAKNGQSIGAVIPNVGYDDVRASLNGTTYRWQIQGGIDSTSQIIQDFIYRIRNQFKP